MVARVITSFACLSSAKSSTAKCYVGLSLESCKCTTFDTLPISRERKKSDRLESRGRFYFPTLARASTRYISHTAVHRFAPLQIDLLSYTFIANHLHEPLELDWSESCELVSLKYIRFIRRFILTYTDQFVDHSIYEVIVGKAASCNLIQFLWLVSF